MRVLILTAGYARRLRPLTDHVPKCLLQVAGTPILRRSLDHLVALGMKELVVVTGHEAGKVRDAITHWYPKLSVTFIDNPDYLTTNNAYSLLMSRPALDGREFFLLDGDILYDAGAMEKLLAAGPDCLALRTGALGLEEVKVELDGGGRIAAIGKEVPVPSAAGESVGIQYFSAATSTALYRALDQRVMAEGRVDEYYEASFQQMIEGGVHLRAIDIAPFYAIEIDTREDLAAANETLLARASRTDSAAL
jgi:choline kinase